MHRHKHDRHLEPPQTQDMLSLTDGVTDGETNALTDKETTFVTQNSDILDSAQEPPQATGFLPSITSAGQITAVS